ncbi:MAG: protein-glutamate O-methyltransferase CheR [Candidatus Eremiobacteraeota bacterium]|nr:protein-glutamate O-methyltransferase CheR [Candidatus Eremiobacteraeota bacterium]
MQVSNEEFALFSRYIYQLTGLSLDESKKYLLETRFEALARELGCATISELHLKSVHDPRKIIPHRIIDLITTHETFFFRDHKPFEVLRAKMVKKFIHNPGSYGNPVRSAMSIWSAACSTGQEIYSIAMVARELLREKAIGMVTIMGTDISDECVAKASYGRYSSLEVERGLSPERLRTNFIQDGSGWKVKDELRAMTTFRRLNLIEDFSLLGRFDIIFCRNVAIYFSQEDKKKLFERFAAHMGEESILILGSTETLFGVTGRFLRVEDEYGIYYRLAS